MLIGTKQHTAGNRTRYWVDYIDWLEDGRTLNQVSGSSVSIITPAPAPADVTVSVAQINQDRFYYWVQGGSVNETFTVQIQVTDTLGEIVIDTVQFTVVQP